MVLSLAVGTACAATFAAPPLAAQILRLPRPEPDPAFWAALNVGYFQTGAVADGRTQSVWRFSDAVQYRAALEYAIARQTTVGVAGTFARVPLRYEASAPDGAFSRDARADVTSLMATFHAGGGVGFHYVVDAGAGVTQYGNFRDEASSARLPPSRDTDFSFAVGTGFAFAPNARLEIYIVQDYGLIVHQRDGLDNYQRTSTQQYVTRLGARYGVGDRRARR